MIAMAICANPDVLIADEPTTALDVTTQARIMDLLSRLVEERQMAVVLITHDLGLAAAFCDELHVMYGGRIVERGDAAAVFGRPLHPYTEALLESICRLDRDVDRPISAIAGPAAAAAEPSDRLHLSSALLVRPGHLRRARAGVDRGCRPGGRVSLRTRPREGLVVTTATRASLADQCVTRGRTDVGRGSDAALPHRQSRQRSSRARGRRRLVLAHAWRDARPRRRVGFREIDARRLLLRLDTPTSGRVLFEGADIFARARRS